MKAKNLSIWLLSTCFMIYLVICIGGLTRLTKSGLSIIEWKPITGVIPPLNDTEWQKEFNKYKQYPEYKNRLQNMSLSEYKTIYWWEYLHRLLARLIGLIFFIPFIIFLLQNKLSKKHILMSITVSILIGIQGFIGWYMVKSGLVDNPHVSHYRLALHLGLALLIFVMLYWEYLTLQYSKRQIQFKPLVLYFSIFLFLLIIQIIYGAFAAGLKVGYIHNTFPLMSGEMVPDYLIAKNQTFWQAITENKSMIQWIHRILGIVLLIYSAFLFKIITPYKNLFYAYQTKALYIWFSVLVLQFLLGIATLLLAVPIWLGSLHQNVGFFLLVSSIYFFHSLRYTNKGI